MSWIAGMIAASCSSPESQPNFPPDVWGPHDVGVREYVLEDKARDLSIGTLIWYPSVPPNPDDEPVRHLYLVEGFSYPELPLERSGAPYPVVLFSHGHQGINFQSFSFTAFLASHGFVVAAPNHRGDTILDDPTPEEMAALALQRPIDLAFVWRELSELNADPSHPLAGAMNLDRLGVAGHSLGATTALSAAGAVVDVDQAKVRCLGNMTDLLCPFVDYLAPGSVIGRPDELAHVAAALSMAPPGYTMFGPKGLAEVAVPALLIAGELDEFVLLDVDPRPIFGALPPPSVLVEMTRTGHMTFSDFCRPEILSLFPDLDYFCNPSTYLSPDRAFAIIDAFGTAFFRRYLKDETKMDDYLSTASADAFSEATLQRHDP